MTRLDHVRTPVALAALLLLLAVAPAALAQTEQRLTVAASVEPDTIDVTSSAYPPGAYVVLKNINETLWGYRPDGSVVPTVADWQIAPDAMSVTFKIHPGIKFHSGDELTADDVAFSEQRLATKMISFRRHGQFIDHVEAVDRYTARVVFKQPDVTFFDGVTFLLVSKAYHDRVGEDEFIHHPVGIGPYRFVDYKPGQYIDLAAFDGYYGPKPQFPEVRVNFVADAATRVAELRAGEVDMIMDTPYPDVPRLAKDGFAIVKVPANPTVSMEFAAGNPNVPWHDQRVREAIAHAIDGDAIVKGLFSGVPARYPRLAPGEPGYDPKMANYSYDPALARKLLADAGFAGGFKMPLYYPTGNFYGFKETAEAVALYLKAVGIDADVQGADNVRVLGIKRTAQSDPASADFVGLSSMPVANSGLSPLDMLEISYFSTSPSVIYKLPEVDRQIVAAQKEIDPDKRAEHVQAALGMIQQNVASISLWDNVSVYAMKPNLRFTAVQHRMPLLVLGNVSAGP